MSATCLDMLCFLVAPMAEVCWERCCRMSQKEHNSSLGSLLAQNAWLFAGLWCCAEAGRSDRGDCLRGLQHNSWRQCLSGSCQEGVPPHASPDAHAFAGGWRCVPNLCATFIPLKLMLQHPRLPLPSDTAPILLLMCCQLLPTATKREICLEAGSVQMGAMGHECRNSLACTT